MVSLFIRVGARQFSTMTWKIKAKSLSMNDTLINRTPVIIQKIFPIVRYSKGKDIMAKDSGAPTSKKEPEKSKGAPGKSEEKGKDTPQIKTSDPIKTKEPEIPKEFPVVKLEGKNIPEIKTSDPIKKKEPEKPKVVPVVKSEGKGKDTPQVKTSDPIRTKESEKPKESSRAKSEKKWKDIPQLKSTSPIEKKDPGKANTNKSKGKTSDPLCEKPEDKKKDTSIGHTSITKPDSSICKKEPEPPKDESPCKQYEQKTDRSIQCAKSIHDPICDPHPCDEDGGGAGDSIPLMDQMPEMIPWCERKTKHQNLHLLGGIAFAAFSIYMIASREFFNLQPKLKQTRKKSKFSQ